LKIPPDAIKVGVKFVSEGHRLKLVHRLVYLVDMRGFPHISPAYRAKVRNGAAIKNTEEVNLPGPLLSRACAVNVLRKN
jgi:hypothetical protein